MILVTGGLGFIGSHTVASLLQAGHEVVATKFRTGRIPSFLADRKFAIESVDVAGPHAVIEAALKHKITSIIHLVVTPLGALSPAEDYRMNMSGLINVLEAGRIAGGEAHFHRQLQRGLCRPAARAVPRGYESAPAGRFSDRGIQEDL